MPQGRKKGTKRGFGYDQDPGVGKATQFTSTNQPPGHKKGRKSIVRLIKKELFSETEWKNYKGADLLDEDGNLTGETVDVRIKMVTVDALVLNYVNMALTEKDIMRDVIDRIDGRAPQVFGLGLLGDDDMEIIFDGLGGGDNYNLRKDAEALLLRFLDGEKGKDLKADVEKYFEEVKDEYGFDEGEED
jgi:hypothetical protein